MTHWMGEDEMAIATSAVNQLQASVEESVRALMDDDVEILFMEGALRPTALRNAPDSVLELVGQCAVLAISQTVIRLNRERLENPTDEH